MRYFLFENNHILTDVAGVLVDLHARDCGSGSSLNLATVQQVLAAKWAVDVINNQSLPHELSIGELSLLEMSTNLRKLAQCPEKVPTRTFSLLKLSTSALLRHYYKRNRRLNTVSRHEIGTLVCKDHNKGGFKNLCLPVGVCVELVQQQVVVCQLALGQGHLPSKLLHPLDSR